ncbi:MAG: hypothetical protein OXF02_04545 [Simkaniaceae bacterium]|nr:hypothetical protein [Simkaniaceae bacterium]
MSFETGPFEKGVARSARDVRATGRRNVWGYGLADTVTEMQFVGGGSCRYGVVAVFAVVAILAIAKGMYGYTGDKGIPARLLALSAEDLQ